MNYNHIPQDGTFLSRFMSYMSEQETASVYDLYAGMWLLSAACGRRTFVARPRAPVYLNMYTIFVAESGITRKSTVVRTVSKLARDLFEDNASIALIENNISSSMIEDKLHTRTKDLGYGHLALVSSELAAVLGNVGASNVAAVLTDLYDCPATRSGGGTLARGAVDQRDVWVSFLSASTPTWLFRAVTPAVIEGGFTSRCHFIVSEKPKARIAWPSTIYNDDSHLLNELRDIRAETHLHPEITLNENALIAFRKWYLTRHTHSDPFRASFESREDAHILRIAALLCVNDRAWVIQKRHMTDAIRLVDEVKLTSAALFAGTGERSKWIMGIESIRNVLIAAGGNFTPRSRLYLRCRNYVDSAEFSSIMDTMHESGCVERFMYHNDGAGRPVELYKATPLLRTRGAMDNLIELR